VTINSTRAKECVILISLIPTKRAEIYTFMDMSIDLCVPGSVPGAKKVEIVQTRLILNARY